MKIIAYHGSQTSKLKMYNDSALYFTTSYEQAKSYAKREWDEGLIEGEIPVVYKAELTFNNPYKIENYDDFQMKFTDSNMNEYFREELIEKGYDSAIYNDRKSTLICIFYPSQYKILDIEKLPPSLNYYYNGELNDEDDDINDYYYENDYEDELNEVLKLSNIKLINEQKDFTTFQLPKNIPSNFFKITNSLKDIKNWKARILENNSGGEKLKVGDYDEVGYVMISLKDNTIIPIARSDEHHRGYDIMYEIYESKYKIVPYDYNSRDDTFYGKRTEQEEVVVGNIKNIKNITEKIVMNRDALTLFQYGAIGEFLIKRYYFLNNKEDEFYDDIFNIAIEENLTYDEDKDVYITSAGETLYPDDIYNIGLEKMIQKMFPKMNEFYEFLKDKKFEIYNN